MTTQSWSFAVDHQTDAGFRAWGADFNAKLTAIGLTQTSDTGQINWASVTRPGTSTNAGYEIWRFNDAAHSTAPIFIRLDYGTGGSAARPRVQLTIGTGSNGSGTITGAVQSAVTVSATTGSATGGTVTSYFCYADGFLGIVHGAAGPATGLAFTGFIIGRTVDTNGDPDTLGAFLVRQNSPSSATADSAWRSFRFAATAVNYTEVTGDGQFIHCTGAETGSNVSGDVQAFIAFGPFPRFLPLNAVCAMFISELAEGSTMSATLVGTNSRTYLNVGRQLGEAWTAENRALFGLCMVWE